MSRNPIFLFMVNSAARSCRKLCYIFPLPILLKLMNRTSKLTPKKLSHHCRCVLNVHHNHIPAKRSRVNLSTKVCRPEVLRFSFHTFLCVLLQSRSICAISEGDQGNKRVHYTNHGQLTYMV